MIILSHRGYWRTKAEQNKMAAFQRSWRMGFGIETDIRDINGTLVVSHDTPKTDAMSIDEFFRLYSDRGRGTRLALNVKSDGIAGLLDDAIRRYKITDYFVFDMSVPDTLPYLRRGMQVFTRQSEEEKNPSFYSRAVGIWMDAFYGDWITGRSVAVHARAGKAACVVSPELHGRAPDALWASLARLPRRYHEHVMLCTDYPTKARKYFDEPH